MKKCEKAQIWSKEIMPATDDNFNMDPGNQSTALWRFKADQGIDILKNLGDNVFKDWDKIDYAGDSARNLNKAK